MYNKDDYSGMTVKRANFAHVFGGRSFQTGGQPRKVDKVPIGYIPYPKMGVNYYHNPQSKKIKTNTTSGAKMSNADWKKFIKKNPNWNTRHSDDVVYIEPTVTTQDKPSFMNLTNNTFFGNHAVGLSGWMKKEVILNHPMVSRIPFIITPM